MIHPLSWRMGLVISGLVLFFGILLTYSQPDRVYSQAASLAAAQDGFVDPNNPAASYNGKRLEVTYSNFPAFVPTRHSLLQFSLAGGAASLSNASLLLQLVQNNLPAGASVNLGLYALPDGWNETAVTASSEPAIGALLQTVSINAGFTGQVRFNASAVGAYLEARRTGDGVASFLLRLDGGSGSLGFGSHIFFEDREGSADGVNGNEPLIEIPPPPTATPTATNTPTSTPTPLTPTPTPVKVNNQLTQVSFVTTGSTTAPDKTYPALSPQGVVTTTLKLRNTGKPLRNISFLAVRLTNNNYLLNADGAPGQAGSKLSVLNNTLPGGNQLWDKDETLTQNFRIGLQSRKTFTFQVDVYANIVKSAATEANQTDNADPDELVDSFLIDVDPESPATMEHTLYLPVIGK